MIKDVSTLSFSESVLDFRMNEMIKNKCFCLSQPGIPVLLTRIKEVAKVFLATNSDYNYTEVSSSALTELRLMFLTGCF